LSNQWVQFATEKNRYEHTERHQQIRAQIHATVNRFKQLIGEVETGLQLLRELNLEFDNLKDYFFRINYLILRSIN
jgi:hypothetical protein